MDIKQISKLATQIDTFKKEYIETTVEVPESSYTTDRSPIGFKEFLQSKFQGKVFTSTHITPGYTDTVTTEYDSTEYVLLKKLHHADKAGKTFGFLMRERTQATELWQEIESVFNS